MNDITIYTDGACKGNPGPGGWGVFFQSAGAEKELFGGEPNTTNNRMEMMAVIEALRSLWQMAAAHAAASTAYIAHFNTLLGVASGYHPGLTQRRVLV